MHCVTSPLNDVCNICSKLDTALNSCTVVDFDWSYHFLTCEKVACMQHCCWVKSSNKIEM